MFVLYARVGVMYVWGCVGFGGLRRRARVSSVLNNTTRKPARRGGHKSRIILTKSHCRPYLVQVGEGGLELLHHRAHPPEGGALERLATVEGVACVFVWGGGLVDVDWYGGRALRVVDRPAARTTTRPYIHTCIHK